MKKFLFNKAAKIQPDVMIFYEGRKLRISDMLMLAGAVLFVGGSIVGMFAGVRFDATEPESAEGFKELFDIAWNAAEV